MGLPRNFSMGAPPPERNESQGLPDPGSVVPPRPRVSESLPLVSEESLDSDVTQEEEFGFDSRTGKRFKKLPGVKDTSLIRGGSREIAERASGMSINDMRVLIGEDKDFAEADTFNGGLNSLAETFLPHLRVPPSQEEIEELRQKKVEERRRQSESFEKSRKAWEEEDRERMEG